MKISTNKIVNDYFKFVEKSFENKILSTRAKFQMATNSATGQTINCPVCNELFVRAKGKITCSNRCKATLYTGIDIPVIRRIFSVAPNVSKAWYYNRILSLIDTYVYNTKMPVKSTICCPVCSNAIYKDTYQHSFCNTKCKDRFWNTISTSRFNNRK